MAAAARCAPRRILAITAFVFYTGWPSFSANGLAWFGTGDDPLDVQLGNSFLGDPETGEPRLVPKGRSGAMAAIGFVVAIWGLASLIKG